MAYQKARRRVLVTKPSIAKLFFDLRPCMVFVVRRHSISSLCESSTSSVVGLHLRKLKGVMLVVLRPGSVNDNASANAKAETLMHAGRILLIGRPARIALGIPGPRFTTFRAARCDDSALV